MIKGTKCEAIISVLNKIPRERRATIKEITLDMDKVVRRCFRKALVVIDRFHVQKLVMMQFRSFAFNIDGKAIEKENKVIKTAKGIPYKSKLLANGDSVKQIIVPASLQME